MKIGRNEPCPCGSGKKYKKCCAGKQEIASISKNKAPQLNDNLSAAENFYRVGDFNQAVSICNQILSSSPEHIDTICLLGRIAFKSGNNLNAYELFSKAVKLLPKDARMHYLCGRAIGETGQFNRAIKHVEDAIKLDSKFSEAYNYLGTLYHVMGRTDEVASLALKAVKLDPRNISLHSHQLVSSHCSSKYSENDIFKSHKAWAKQHAADVSIRKQYNNTRDLARRLKVGYVSPSFNTKIVGYFIRPIIENHNINNFEIYCYSNTQDKDDYTDYFKSNTNWRDITAMSDAQAVDLISNDEIDILVDLTGHVPNNKLLVFAHKPAPVQISWLDYYYSTGLDTMDYIITDPISTPSDTNQQFTEDVLRMPATRLCWSAPKFAPEVGELPAIKNSFITFGSFNRPEKMNSDVITIWANILNKVNDARLILKNNSFVYEDTKQHFINSFKHHGIDSKRIEFRGASPYENLLNEYKDIDIALDPFPHNGGATTCDALYMGVPIISLMGSRMISRQTACILTNAGLTDFIANDKDDYIGIAIKWSKQINELSVLRKNIRQMFSSSPVCDAEKFTVDLENLYKDVWKQWCHNNSA